MAKTAVAGMNSRLVEIAMAYQRSRALVAAARRGCRCVGRCRAHGCRTGAACKADVVALHRLLRALASIGIVAETKPGNFVLTDFGGPLRKDAPDSAWPAVVFWADLLADNWVSLTECVRTGKSASTLRPEIMSRWREDPEAPAIFRAVMGTSPADTYMPIARAWDFSCVGTVADLGGEAGR